MADDDEAERADQNHQERPAIDDERERLHQHGNAERDERHRRTFPRSSAEDADDLGPLVHGMSLRAHFRKAPKVMPRRRCRRSNTVKTTIGIRNKVVPAATAGQSCPPSPMMMGMNGGAVCACPEVKRTAKAYSFQAKIRQKIAVAAMPVVA